MKSRIPLFIFFCVTGLFGQYQQALPGYHYSFPRDHFDHPTYQTEWWYYTGNLRARNGHRFGFELTFFRQGVNRSISSSSVWAMRDLYLAHLALGDITDGRFYHVERVNRSGPDLAGASETQQMIWNGNWQARVTPTGQQLVAVSNEFGFTLNMRSDKAPVIQGKGGVSQKSEGLGKASHYISFTRLLTEGDIELNGKRYRVDGPSWMDHEFFTDSMQSDEVGWDWVSLQLADNTEIMLYRLRRKDGSVEPYSSGTYVAADGRSTFLSLADFQLIPAGATWKSPMTHATYPIQWHLAIPSLGIDIEITTPLTSQELASNNPLTPSYWEGAIDVHGQRMGKPVQGVGYLELTGYDQALTLNPLH